MQKLFRNRRPIPEKEIFIINMLLGNPYLERISDMLQHDSKCTSIALLTSWFSSIRPWYLHFLSNMFFHLSTSLYYQKNCRRSFQKEERKFSRQKNHTIHSQSGLLVFLCYFSSVPSAEFEHPKIVILK